MNPMNHLKLTALTLAFALPVSVSAAQSAPAPAKAPVAKAGTTAVRKPGSTATAATAAGGAPKLPPGVPPVKGIIKTGFALKYQDVKIGTGALAEPNKLYKVHYTGWLASDGKKFDSSFDHKTPALDKDGKPEMDADGKPKMNAGEPIQFPQGRGRVIPGWDQGFEGMHIGGKRRIFIPYQLAYGAIGRPPVIPAKSDLIFDVELVDITDFPTAPPGGMPGNRAMPNGAVPPPAPPKPPTPTPTPAAPTATPAPAAPATPPPAPPADKPANPAQPQ